MTDIAYDDVIVTSFCYEFDTPHFHELDEEYQLVIIDEISSVALPK